MAVDVCSDFSSPRISFSHDLKELDIVPVENHNRRSDLNPTVDFDFCIGQHEISSADELFANGKILPVEIKKANNPPKPKKTDVVSGNENTKKKRLIEFLSFDADEEETEKPLSKPFWQQFRRSSSVNCENGRANGLLRSLQFLTRSNSTGSVPNPKPTGFSKAMQKQSSMKEGLNNRVNSSFNQYYYPYNNNNNNNNLKKPSLRKSSSRSYNGNGIRISPVLNIPPTYIAKGTVSLFGIGSFFCSKKSKKKRK